MGRTRPPKGRRRRRYRWPGQWHWVHPWGPCHPPGLSSQEQKGSKKKRDLPKELHQDPPILRVLGSGLVVLEPLLAGESLVSTLCNFGVIRTLESDRLTFLRVPWGQVMGGVGWRGSERPHSGSPSTAGPQSAQDGQGEGGHLP